jgi:Carboxypeptidase regulatory-like domain
VLRLTIVSLVVISFAFGQSERGNITGVITDVSGAPMASVPVTVINKATNTATHASSTGTGEYNVPNLSPGVYQVNVSMPGFRSFTEDNITLTAGATVRSDAQLQVGNVNELVEVKAQGDSDADG